MHLIIQKQNYYKAVKYYLSLIYHSMRSKKVSQSKVEYIPLDQRKASNNYSYSSSIHRKQNKSNKQNVIQVTQPLEPNLHSCLSKQFILSRESLTLNSRPTLKEITKNNNHCYEDIKTIKMKSIEKEQEIFDRRLSLKCTNYSQQLDNQKSHRFSMAAPLRKEIINSHNSHNLIEQGDSSYICQSSSFSNDIRTKQNIKKEVIMTNLMNKLEHQQDLRSIIESKLKNSQNINYSVKDRKNQSYLSQLTEDSNSNNHNAQKLKQCQSELKYFKNIMKQMEQKMIQLSEQKKFSKKRQKVQDIDINEDQIKKDPLVYFMSLFQKIHQNFPKCQNCQNKKNKLTKQIGVQTINTQYEQKNDHNLNQSLDFLDNLQKTLKVLDEKRK